MRPIFLIVLALAFTGCEPKVQSPADLTITNARIITVSGAVIPNGTISIRGDRIAAIEQGGGGEAKQTIDAKGKTILPGLIDTHRHLLPFVGATSEAELGRTIDEAVPPMLEGLLANGLTTVMSPGDFTPEIFEIRERLNEGLLVGPRLIATGPLFTGVGGHPAGGPVCGGRPFCRQRCAIESSDPSAVREDVRRVVEMGADAIKVVIDRIIVPDTVIDEAVVEAIAAEADALGVPLFVHAQTTEDAALAVELGADRLVHTPYVGSGTESGLADRLVQRDISISTTVGYATRQLAEARGTAWDEANYNRQIENIRYLVDQDVLVAFGTDNPPWLGMTEFMYEVEALGTILSPREVIESMTIRAAHHLSIEDRVGTIEPGKIADLIVVEGDPLEDLSVLGNVVMVVKGGAVAVDKR